MGKRVLLAGESFLVEHTYQRGADAVRLQEYSAAQGEHLAEAIRSQGLEVDYIPTEDIPVKFPHTVQELSAYGAVILSDVGSNTLYIDPPAEKGTRYPNRLTTLRNYVSQGGGLLMCGGYLGFSGYFNMARYGMTPLAEALPVKMLDCDDRVERPEGVFPTILEPEHPVFRGLVGESWPDFCGYNRVTAKPEAVQIAAFDSDPFLVGMEFGRGRSFAFTSDCAPNWGTWEFLKWKGYGILFGNIAKWLMREI